MNPNNNNDLTQTTQQLIETFVSYIYQNFSEFGQKCRKYITTQNQQKTDILQLLANNTTNSNKTNNTNNSPIYNPTLTLKQPPFNDQKEYTSIAKQTKPRKKQRQDEETPYIAKRPRNAYNLFVQSQSIKIKQQFPHMRAPDIVRIAAQRYNNMTTQQKQPYMDKFQQAKRIFDQQLKDMGGRAPTPIKRSRGRGSRYDYSLK